MTDSEADREPEDRPGELRHGERQKPFAPPSGTSHLDEITAHVERHFGKVDRVLHELVSDLVHVDVLVVEPTVDDPRYTLVTCGMSDLPMQVPAGEKASRHAELFVQFVDGASLTQEAFADEKVYWPIRKLKMLSRMPHELDTFVAAGHTIATDPPEPVAEGVPFCALGLLAPLDAKAQTLHCGDGTRIDFLQVVPMYREELEWKLAQPHGALAELFDSPALRVAFEGRPNLKGAEADARIEAAMGPVRARIARGRALVLGIASALLLVAVAEIVAAKIDGDRVRWSRCAIAAFLAMGVAERRTWARWAGIATCSLMAVGGVKLLAETGVVTAVQHVLAASVVVWAVAGLMLVFSAAVRADFDVGRRMREMLARAKEGAE